jgi:hypothetical protein
MYLESEKFHMKRDPDLDMQKRTWWRRQRNARQFPFGTRKQLLRKPTRRVKRCVKQHQPYRRRVDIHSFVPKDLPIPQRSLYGGTWSYIPSMPIKIPTKNRFVGKKAKRHSLKMRYWLSFFLFKFRKWGEKVIFQDKKSGKKGGSGYTNRTILRTLFYQTRTHRPILKYIHQLYTKCLSSDTRTLRTKLNIKSDDPNPTDKDTTNWLKKIPIKVEFGGTKLVYVFLKSKHTA